MMLGRGSCETVISRAQSDRAGYLRRTVIEVKSTKQTPVRIGVTQVLADCQATVVLPMPPGPQSSRASERQRLANCGDDRRTANHARQRYG